MEMECIEVSLESAKKLREKREFENSVWHSEQIHNQRKEDAEFMKMLFALGAKRVQYEEK